MNTCEALAAQASAGVAPALEAVDCLANSMAAGAFARLFGAQGGLLPALTVLLTLYIALFAFALITGRSRIGISVLTPRMVTLGVVLTFATSWMAWQQVVWNLAIGAPDEIASMMLGTNGPATRLFADRIDMVLGAIAQVGSALAGGDGTGAATGAATSAQVAASGGAFSPQGLMWLGAMLLLLGTVGVLVTARIALAVLLAVGPVFVVMGLFPQTRGLTAGWARSLVLTALVPLFVVAGGSMMLELAVPVVSALDGSVDGGPPGVNARAAMALFLVASVHCALMAMLLRVAGTTVADWTVFGLGNARGTGSEGQALAASAAAGGMVFAQQAAGAPGATTSQPRGAIHVPMPAIADTGSPPTSSTRTTTTMINTAAGAPPSGLSSAMPRSRAQGIGSRFAAPGRRPALRETR